MEQEKKKRERPTWAMVKDLQEKVSDLQKRLDSQIDGTHMLVADCDGWREKYHALLDEKREVEELKARYVARIEELKGNEHPKEGMGLVQQLGEDIEELKGVKAALENELSAKSDALDKLEQRYYMDINARDQLIARLKGRGFWKRLFNR